jgi:hypothetical protein
MKPLPKAGLPRNPPGKPDPAWDDYSWDNPETWDPLLDIARHPELYAGYNFDAIAADEFNGAGVNEPVWPTLFDASVMFKPNTIDPRDWTTGFEECPDYVVRPVNRCLDVPTKSNRICVKR